MDDTSAPAGFQDAADLQQCDVALHEFVRELGSKGRAFLDSRLTVLLPAPHAFAYADPRRLEQALLGLLRHVADADGEGSVELCVLRERNGWRFEVTYEAAALPLADEDVALHRDRPSELAGRLAVVRGVAEAHFGSAGVDFGPSGGATVWLRVPQPL